MPLSRKYGYIKPKNYLAYILIAILASLFIYGFVQSSINETRTLKTIVELERSQFEEQINNCIAELNNPNVNL